MKTLAILSLAAAGFVTASAQSVSPTLSAPSLRTSSGEPMALAPKLRASASDGEKTGQVWILLSYEHFAGDKGGDEFGFTPTSVLGYQRNFYPDGRLKNGVGYSLGVGLGGVGAGLYYHQGSARRVDFRVGLALDVFFSSNFYGGSAVGVLPFLSWGVKV